MTGFLEDDALRFEGLDDQDIADLNAALPALSGAIQIAQVQWPEAMKILAAASVQWPLIKPHIPALLRIASKIIAKQKELTP
ncbi:MAG: hypothetical protein WB868_16315 [Xanthobacteraceae bacterium]